MTAAGLCRNEQGSQLKDTKSMASNSSAVRWGLGLAVLVFLGGYIYNLTTDEARIKRLINRGRNAVVKKNILSLAGIISRDFKGPHNETRDVVMAVAHEAFSRQEAVELTLLEVSVSMSGQDTAVVTVKARFNGQEGSHAAQGLEIQGDEGSFLVGVTREDTGWMITSITPVGQP